MFGQIGGQQGTGGPLSPDSIGGESFIRHVGNDKLIFDFHEGSGTVVHDKSHCGNNGVLTNPTDLTWGRGKLHFGGTNGYVSIADNASLNFGTGDFSIILWMKAENDTTRQVMAADSGIAAGVCGWEVTYRGDLINDPIRVQMGDGSVGAYYTLNFFTNGLAGKGLKSVIFIAKRDSLGTIYLNGVNIISSNITSFSGSIDNTNILAIGRQAHLDMRYFVGDMKCRILNKGLSGIECQQIYLSNKFKGNG